MCGILGIVDFASPQQWNTAQFRTESDTEVLLEGLCLRGMDFVQRCIGMFAFCFVDVQKAQAMPV